MFKRMWITLMVVALALVGVAACTSVGPATDAENEPSAIGDSGAAQAPGPTSSGPAVQTDAATSGIRPAAEMPVAVERESADMMASSLPVPGYGGGGGYYGGPFVDADVTLNAPLPEVSEAAVYALPDPYMNPTLSEEEVRAFAAQFGIDGPVYYEWYPGLPLNADSAVQEGTPLNYFMFGPDRQRVMAFGNGELLYEDSTIYQPGGEFDDTPLPFDERAALAERFASEKGLLDFEYDIHPGWMHEVHFLPLIDGHPATWARLVVQVLPSGAVGSVIYRPIGGLTMIEQGPLRSAEAAFTYLQDNLDGNLAFNLYPTDPTYHTPGFPDGERINWQREFVPGTNVSMMSWIQVFRPADGSSTPRIVTDRNMVIEADADTLNQLAETSMLNGNVRLNGVVGGEPGSLTLALDSWESLDVPSDLYLSGTSRLVDGQAYFEFPGGFRAQLVNPPDDLPDGVGISVYSWGMRTGDDGVSALLDWVNIDRLYPPLTPEMEPIEADPYSGISNILVNEVDLAYWYLYPYDVMPLTMEPYRENENAHLVPMWRFSGETNKGDVVDIFVPALESAELAEPVER